jgi:hypothetical protein
LGAPEGTEEGDKLDVLLALVNIYETKRWPIDIDENFDPIDVLRYANVELGHTQAELAEHWKITIRKMLLVEWHRRQFDSAPGHHIDITREFAF